jgi:hypothetical protein
MSVLALATPVLGLLLMLVLEQLEAWLDGAPKATQRRPGAVLAVSSTRTSTPRAPGLPDARPSPPASPSAHPSPSVRATGTCTRHQGAIAYVPTPMASVPLNVARWCATAGRSGSRVPATRRRRLPPQSVNGSEIGARPGQATEL